MPACDISEIGRADTSARVGLGTNGTARSAASDSGDLGGSAGSGSEQDRAYIPRPLQPNNCGTPDTFKACRVVASASIGPRKPEVLLEVLKGTGAEPAALMNDLRWTRKIGQEVKLGLLLRRTDLNDGQTEAVFGGIQGEGCS
jgi:hypothetical protein